MGIKKGTLIRMLPRPGSKSGIRERWLKEDGSLWILRFVEHTSLSATSLATGKTHEFINDWWEVADEDEA